MSVPNKNIKQKLGQHEFDFSPGAWENMEALLDGSPKKSYFKTKTLIAMITGILFFLFLLLKQEPVQEAFFEMPTAQIYKNENRRPTEKLPKVAHPIFEKTLQSLATSTNPESNADSSFVNNVEAKIDAYNKFYKPEKVYLHFDRLFFKPGEAIWFNAFLRDANSLKASSTSEILHVQLLSPNGKVMKKITLKVKDGSAAGDFQLDKSAKGGLYKVKAYTNWQRNRNDFFERDIQVQASVLPRLRMKLDFMRKAYGPGDEVTAKVDLQTLANQPLKNHPFTAVISIEGQQIKSSQGQTDEQGKTRVQFNLPSKLNTPDGLLNILISYNGQTESISRSIPIVLNNIDLQFMPEGGDIIAGLPAIVAFKALNEFGKPADVEGIITNSKGETVSNFRSYHQGMGAFEMPTATDETYQAYLTKPEGIAKPFQLPEIIRKGHTIQADPSQPDKLSFIINSNIAETLHLVLLSQGEVYFSQTLPAKKGPKLITIPTVDLPIGIAQATLFDSKEIPRAERLVFLNPHKQLNIKVKTNKEKYLPREKVSMTVSVTDERGMPMPGQFSLSVVDDNLLTFADDKQGHILSSLLLESELTGDIDEPNFYFDPPEKHSEKDQLLALDYLMMTQGWRRFDWDQVLWKQAIALKYRPEALNVRGKILDGMGQPASDMKVRMLGIDQVDLTDGQGQFALDAMLPQKPIFEVQKNGSKETQYYIPFFENGELVLKPPYKIERQFPPAALAGQSKKKSVLKGQLSDLETGEAIVFAPVTLHKDDKLIMGAYTDQEGNFEITNLESDIYDIVFHYVGYQDLKIEDVQFNSGQTNHIEGQLSSGINLDPILVIYEPPIISRDQITLGSVISTNKTKNLPTRNVNDLASLGKAQKAEPDDAIDIRGSRSEPTNNYIDGIRVSPDKSPVPPANAPIIKENKDIEDFMVEEPAIEELAEIEEEIAFDSVENPQMIAADQMNNKRDLKKVDKDRLAFDNPATKANDRIKMIGGSTYVPKWDFHTPRQFYVPKYAGDRSKIAPATRNDFRKTIFWKPDLKLDRRGKATIEFYNSDAITTFRASIEGLGTDGSIGRAEHRFYTQLPFGMDVKIPDHLLTLDHLTIPLTLMNHTDNTIEGKININTPSHFSLLKKLPETVMLKAGESKTIYPSYKVGPEARTGKLEVSFEAEGQSDSFSETIHVSSKGFPVSEVYSSNELNQTFVMNLKDPIEGSTKMALTVHPSVLSDLTTGLERMLRQPSGCFEQTSSGNYPNILVLNYLQTTGNAAPELEERANNFLDYGYKRLLTFEVNSGGFDWYGKPPGHEALSAYGLMQFVDMKAVYPVSQDLIDRTAKWLLTRRDGNGSWLSDRLGLHSWHQKSPIADAYISWALTEAGYGSRITKEINKSVQDALDTQDPYLLALAANILLNTDRNRAGDLLSKLSSLQNEDGSWMGKTHSMTHSTGNNLRIETTALSAIAFMKGKNIAVSEDGTQSAFSFAQRAIDFLTKSKTSYGFGSTQATVLALKALVKHAENSRENLTTGQVMVYVNGKKAGQQKMNSGQEAIIFDELENLLKEGKNEVKIEFAETTKALPYDLALNYHTRLPQSSQDCLLNLNTSLASEKNVSSACKMGETQRLTVELENLSTGPVSNPIAIIGIPAGLSIQPWQVKELQEKGLFDFYEINKGNIVFYFRHFEEREIKTIQLDLKADIPGKYEAPASSAYLYYANDAVVWDKPERVEIND